MGRAQITVQVSEGMARALQSRGPWTQELDVLRRRAEELGADLQQMFPGVEDATLMTFLLAEVPDAEDANRIAAELRRCPGVEAAYVKPAAEPP